MPYAPDPSREPYRASSAVVAYPVGNRGSPRAHVPGKSTSLEPAISHSDAKSMDRMRDAGEGPGLGCDAVRPRFPPTTDGRGPSRDPTVYIISGAHEDTLVSRKRTRSPTTTRVCFMPPPHSHVAGAGGTRTNAPFPPRCTHTPFIDVSRRCSTGVRGFPPSTVAYRDACRPDTGRNGNVRSLAEARPTVKSPRGGPIAVQHVASGSACMGMKRVVGRPSCGGQDSSSVN